jgi:microcystin-dependent protein
VHNHQVAPMPVQGQANFRISDNVADALASRNNAFGQGTGPLPNTTSVCQIYDKTPTFGENNHLHPSTVSSSVEQVPASNTGSVGAAQPFSVQNPFLALNYIICISGLYPSRQ